MSDEGPSTSQKEEESQNRAPAPLFITHKVSKLDTLAGLAVRYNVAVADIKRANSLLSDSAMFAKDTILIPTQKMTCGVQYSTWAGMIVAQYGRIGDHNHLAATALGFSADSPPRHSAALDHLQRYYGTGDSSSEPPDFRPGDPDGAEGSVSGTEIELSDLDHLGRLSEKFSARDTSQPLPESVEYAGSKSGNLADERVRRRRASESFSGNEILNEQEESGHILLNAPDPIAGSSPDRGFIHNMRMASNSAGNLLRNLTPESPRRRESLYERLKRVASQPALASSLPPPPPRINDLTETLPPLHPSARRTNSGSGKVREKEIKKKE